MQQWCGLFLAQITCDGGNPGSITDDSKWGDLRDEFSTLDDSYKSTAATANADKDSDNVVEKAMARYDLILRKYGIGTESGQHDDFIGRFSAGGFNYSAHNGLLIDDLNAESQGSLITAIIVFSIGSITAIGSYLFLRKRKQVK